MRIDGILENFSIEVVTSLPISVTLGRVVIHDRQVKYYDGNNWKTVFSLSRDEANRLPPVLTSGDTNKIIVSTADNNWEVADLATKIQEVLAASDDVKFVSDNSLVPGDLASGDATLSDNDRILGVQQGSFVTDTAKRLLPSTGTTNEVIVKKSVTDYDFELQSQTATPTTIPNNGLTGSQLDITTGTIDSTDYLVGLNSAGTVLEKETVASFSNRFEPISVRDVTLNSYTTKASAAAVTATSDIYLNFTGSGNWTFTIRPKNAADTAILKAVLNDSYEITVTSGTNSTRFIVSSVATGTSVLTCNIYRDSVINVGTVGTNGSTIPVNSSCTIVASGKFLKKADIAQSLTNEKDKVPSVKAVKDGINTLSFVDKIYISMLTYANNNVLIVYSFDGGVSWNTKRLPSGTNYSTSLDSIQDELIIPQLSGNQILKLNNRLSFTSNTDYTIETISNIIGDSFFNVDSSNDVKALSTGDYAVIAQNSTNIQILLYASGGIFNKRNLPVGQGTATTPVSLVGIVDANTYYVASKPNNTNTRRTIWKTSNAGVSWTTLSNTIQDNFLKYQIWHSVKMVADNEWYALSSLSATSEADRGLLLKSVDEGVSWTTESTIYLDTYNYTFNVYPASGLFFGLATVSL